MIDYSKKFIFSSSNLINLLCYPKFSFKEYLVRLDEIMSLNLKFAILEGNTVLNNVEILGKGTEGLVIKVKDTMDETMALKIKRTDSCRINMKKEFDLYKLVNKNNIGPKVYCSTKNLLLMEFIDGMSAIDWFMNTKLDIFLIKSVIYNILNQCYILDKLNIDHGQLNRLNNHIIISYDGSRCTIVDFETASNTRKVTNLTSAIQGLIFKGIISDQINKFINYKDKRTEFLGLLKLYKHQKSKENFDSILSLI